MREVTMHCEKSEFLYFRPLSNSYFGDEGVASMHFQGSERAGNGLDAVSFRVAQSIITSILAYNSLICNNGRLDLPSILTCRASRAAGHVVHGIDDLTYLVIS